MGLFEKIYIVQLSKDSIRGLACLVNVGLVWLYNNDAILSFGILLLIADVLLVALHLIHKKFTFADLKDFISVLCLLIYVILTIFVGNAEKRRLVYCIFYAIFAFVDLGCVGLHISSLFSLYTTRLSVEMHNSAAKALNIDNSFVDPY